MQLILMPARRTMPILLAYRPGKKAFFGISSDSLEDINCEGATPVASSYGKWRGPAVSCVLPIRPPVDLTESEQKTDRFVKCAPPQRATAAGAEAPAGLLP